MAFKYRDGMILGGIAGLLATTPKISSFIADQLAFLIPVNLQFLGNLSIPFYGIILGIIGGYIVDKT